MCRGSADKAVAPPSHAAVQWRQRWRGAPRRHGGAAGLVAGRRSRLQRPRRHFHVHKSAL